MQHRATTEFTVRVIEDGEDVLNGKAGATAQGMAEVAEVLASVARTYGARARKLRGHETPTVSMIIAIGYDGRLYEGAEFNDTPRRAWRILSSLAENYALAAAEGSDFTTPSGPADLDDFIEERKAVTDRTCLAGLLSAKEFAKLEAEGGLERLEEKGIRVS